MGIWEEDVDMKAREGEIRKDKNQVSIKAMGKARMKL